MLARMNDTPAPTNVLQQQAALLLAYASQARLAMSAREEELAALVRDAQRREHRRAKFNERDSSCYRIGAAFEPTNGLDLDPVALSGFLALGTTGLLLLVRAALDHPEASVSEQLAALFRSEAGAALRAWGSWSRWCWLRALYVAETTTFLASAAGQDPAAKWRRERATAEQGYLAAAICLDLGIAEPRFNDRGSAFDWIMKHGGNPRFQEEPARPDLDALVASVWR
jgi:hypothetical protein